MNFKTTVVLIVLLAVAGIALFFTRNRGEEGAASAKSTQKLFDLAESDVNKLVVTPGDGKKMVLEKTSAKWRMTEPVNAPADAFESDTLVRAITKLESRGEVSGNSADAKATGLDHPRYTIDISTSGGKSYTLLVGDKVSIGDNLYISRKDQAQTRVVAAELLENLDKPVFDYRDKKLVTEYNTATIGQITLNRPDGKLVLSKSGEDWKITEPTPMPAEKSDVDDIVFGLTGLNAVEFVSEDAGDAAMYQLDQPRITATLATTRPATQPATAPTSQPAPLVIKFGRFDDVLKKNVMVMTSQSPAIAKVSAVALDAISKRPFELRDRRVLDLDPAQASSVVISTDVAATTRPTFKPGSKKEVSLKRRKESAVLGPTVPATTKSATRPATQPASKWEFASGSSENKAANDIKVESVLVLLHPLRARSYMEKSPATQPAATYVVKITTEGPGGTPVNHYDLTLADPGNSGQLIGTYNGLTFEVDRFMVDRVSGDFAKGSRPGVPAAGVNEGETEPTGP